MQAGNTTRNYGWVTRSFHWTIAILILTGMAIGLYAETLPSSTDSDIAQLFTTYSVHKTIGIAVLVLAVLRILWAITQPRPAPLHPNRRAETLLGETVHWALYCGMIIMPLSGWLRHSSAPGEFARIVWPFGQRLPGMPVDEIVSAAFSAIHKTSWLVLAALILLHVAGALKHALIDRDATLSRMGGRSTDLPEPPAGPHLPAFAAPLLALAIWAVAISLALGIGGEDDAPATAPVEQAQSAAPAEATAATEPASEAQPVAEATGPIWAVQQGNLGITVVQGNSPVTGQFADWDAEITYDPDTQTGQVSLSIPLESLSLGSVTSTALGPDFMKAGDHPISTFEADIRAEADGHIAEGTMTLAGAEAPVTLPFDLQIESDTATMTGQTALDRRDFDVGAGYADESTVGFTVTVDVDLTATRQ